MTKQECIENVLPEIPEDEPIFVLRASDRFAGQVVREWADLVEATAYREAELTGRRQQIVATARRVALAMDKWPTKRLPE